MLNNFLLRTHFWARIRLTPLVIVFTLLISLVACREKAPEVTAEPTREVVVTAWTAEPTQEVVVTAWTAVVIGELINIDGCVRIRNPDIEVDYAIVWTPDVSATIEGETIRIISGIVRGNISEVVLNFGDIVRFSGGETSHPDEQLLQNLPSNCQGPYWVVGFEIAVVQTTVAP